MSAVGDSLTARSNSNTIQTADTSPAQRGFYYDYALMLPPTGESFGGRIIPGGVSATTGHHIQDVIDTHIPTILGFNPKPNICSVLIGANDGADFDDPDLLAAHIANMVIICDTLIANEVFPILCGLPSAVGTNRDNFQLFNAELQTLATSYNIPYVDMFSATDNGVDGWISGYTADNIHPNSVGAKAMAQEWINTVEPWLLSPPELTTVADYGLWTNSLMQNDGDSDGVPNGGQIETVACWSKVGFADCTSTLVADPGVVVGNWWDVDKTLNNGATTFTTAGGNPSPNITDGHAIAYGYMFEVISADASAEITVQGAQIDNGTIVPFRMKLLDLQAGLDPFIFYVTRTTAGLTKVRFSINLTGGLAHIRIGQFTVRDLSV